MLEALELIASRHSGEAVAAVTHAVMIRLALMELSGIDGEGWRKPVRRGSVTEFRYERGSVVVVPASDDNGSAALGATTAGPVAKNGSAH
jgi:broad specificity phosphatase PhoE